METVRSIGIDDDLRGLLGFLEGLAHLLDGADRNAVVGTAIKAEHRRLQRASQLDRMLGMKFVRHSYQPSIPGNAGFEIWIVSGIEPDDPSAPAKAGDAELVGVSLAGLFRPGHGRIEVVHHLLIRDLRHDLQNVRKRGQLRDISLAGIQLRRDCEVAELGEASADVLNVLVDAEYLLNHEDHWKVLPLLRRSAVSRHLAVLRRYFHFAGF